MFLIMCGVIVIYFIFRQKCPLIKIDNDAFEVYEKPFILVDSEFKPHIIKIANFANTCKVKVLVTSSFRYSDHIKDPLVPPAKISNHMVGHAIDMNLYYG